MSTCKICGRECRRDFCGHQHATWYLMAGRRGLTVEEYIESLNPVTQQLRQQAAQRAKRLQVKRPDLLVHGV